MEHTFDASNPGANSFGTFRNANRVAEPTILIVEDDRDIRDMMSTLLDLAGFASIACDSAEAALAALRQRPVDLILTDYALPSHTGFWLLERAEAEGLIHGTPVMIVTAYPDPTRGSAYEVVQKPFDLDYLLDRVKRRMGEKSGHARRAGTAPLSKNGGGGDRQRDPGCPEPVELILYVSAESFASAAAIKNIQKVLSRFSKGRVKLTVCDASVDAGDPADHGMAITPPIVRTSPAPRTYILGHVTNPELLLELLSDCELDEN